MCVCVCFCVLRRCCFFVTYLDLFCKYPCCQFFLRLFLGATAPSAVHHSSANSCGRCLLDKQAHNGAVAEAGGEERQAVGGERHGLHSTAAVRVALQLNVLLLAVEEAA